MGLEEIPELGLGDEGSTVSGGISGTLDGTLGTCHPTRPGLSVYCISGKRRRQ